MLSRSVAIFFSSTLAAAALILRLGAAQTINALVAGAVGIFLSVASVADDRARVGAAVLGAWVAISTLIFPSRILGNAVVVSWGGMMVACMLGPFSDAPAPNRMTINLQSLLTVRSRRS